MSTYLSSACLAERLCLCTWATRESGVVRSIPYVQFSHVYVLVGRNPKTTESALTFVRLEVSLVMTSPRSLETT